MSADTPSPPRRQGTTASGLLLVDKIQGWTSHDAVARTRRLAGTRKVGHAGTLDPMATGLLVLGLNSSTRLLTFVVGLDKEYFATIRLGAATTTDDAEGEELTRAPDGAVAALTPEAVAAGMTALTGHISQRPSSVSAIKVDGERAYARVRRRATALPPGDRQRLRPAREHRGRRFPRPAGSRRLRLRHLHSGARA